MRYQKRIDARPKYTGKKYRDLFRSEVEGLSDRLWSQVDVNGPDECWFWMGYARSRKGSLRESPEIQLVADLNDKSARRGSLQVQRVVWALEHGVAPAEWRYETTCGFDLCCNPRHLGTIEMRGEYITQNGKEYFVAVTEDETPGVQLKRMYN